MKQESFTGFMHEVMDGLRQEERFATAHIYKYALAAVTDFVGGGEIFFGALTRRWLKRFQEYLDDLIRFPLMYVCYVRCTIVRSIVD